MPATATLNAPNEPSARSPLASVRATPPAPAAQRRFAGGSLSVMLLAALVAALVLVADRFVGTWADEHLFLGWVALWVVIFAGLALFAGTARRFAVRAMDALDGWSQARARARAESRLWAIARSDLRVMADLVAIRADRESKADCAVAPAPVGTEGERSAPVLRGWAAHIERIGQSRVRNPHLHHI